MLPDNVSQTIMDSLGYLRPPQDADNSIQEDEALTVLKSYPSRLNLIHDEGIHQRHHCEDVTGKVPNVVRAHEALLEEGLSHLSPTPWQMELLCVSLHHVQGATNGLDVLAEQCEFSSSDTLRHQGVHPVADVATDGVGHIQQGWGRARGRPRWSSSQAMWSNSRYENLL